MPGLRHFLYTLFRFPGAPEWQWPLQWPSETLRKQDKKRPLKTEKRALNVLKAPTLSQSDFELFLRIVNNYEKGVVKSLVVNPQRCSNISLWDTSTNRDQQQLKHSIRNLGPNSHRISATTNIYQPANQYTTWSYVEYTGWRSIVSTCTYGLYVLMKDICISLYYTI